MPVGVTVIVIVSLVVVIVVLVVVLCCVACCLFACLLFIIVVLAGGTVPAGQVWGALAARCTYATMQMKALAYVNICTYVCVSVWMCAAACL